MKLRKWQQEAMEKYRVSNPRDFLVTATPGAGKTTFALTVAGKLLQAKAINQVIIVVPTAHLRKQWGDSAIEKGIFLDPSLPNDNRLVGEDFVGYVATYAQVAMNPAIHMRRATATGKRTLVLFDELHHAGDGLAWGDALNLAFKDASRRLALTGTPFRSGDNSRIPFVRYEDDGSGNMVSVSDYTYGYKEGLADHVVRPVTFAAYSGTTKWTNSAGDVYSARLLGDDLTKQQEQVAWRTALDPKGSWIPHVLTAADERLTAIREAGMKDAGAMILASDQDSAKAYAALLKKITKTTPTLVISDDNSASKKIAAFSESKDPKDRWLVAVRMVSEGVDVPRLAVGVWATNYRTPLFFAQAVGRFVRARHKGEVATVFLPAVRPLLALAAEMEEQRRHVIAPPKDDQDLGEVEEIPESPEDEVLERNRNVALHSDAEFAHILYNGKAVVGEEDLSDDDKEYLGLPGLLSPSQMATLLRKRDEELKRAAKERGEVIDEEHDENPMMSLEIRKDINRMVSRIALRRGVGHAHIHKLVRNAVAGPPTAHADLETLKKRKAWLEENYF